MAETVITFGSAGEHVLGDERRSPEMIEMVREQSDETLTPLRMLSNVDEFGYEPIYRDNSPVCLSWENLTVKTKPKKRQAEGKVLLNNLSGMITGGLWEIMGPSGSGKAH